MKGRHLVPVLLSLCFLSGERAERDRTFVLNVATWNIENFSRRRSGLHGEENRNKLRALGEIIAGDLGRPDIIALQEVMDDSGTADDGTVRGDRNFRTLARSLRRRTGVPWGYVTLPPADGRDGGRKGANIRTGFLYNRERVAPLHPPERWESRAFEDCRKPLRVVFLCGGYGVELINVHLSSRTGDGQEGEREAQGAYLEERIRERGEESRRILLLGDFNDYPDSPVIAGLEKRASLVSLVDGTSYLFRNRANQLDHMLASPALAAELTRSRAVPVLEAGIFRDQPSDHNPLGAVFLLTPEGYSPPPR